MLRNLLPNNENFTALVLPLCMLYLFLSSASIFALVKSGAGKKNPLKQQIFAWWAIFPVITIALFYYPIGIFLLMLFICSLTANELRKHFTGKQWLFNALYLLLLAFLVALHFFETAFLQLVLPALLTLQLLIFQSHKTSNRLLILLFIFSCFGISYLDQFSRLFIAEEKNIAWLFYLFLITALNDVAQFIFGSTLGVRKIATHISPNKTWLGLMGGISVSTLLSVAIGTYLQLADKSALVLLALLLSISGFLGDMLFSAAKRFLKLKDFSQLIPGHGGILDRADSLILTAPLLYWVLYVISPRIS